MEGVTNSKNSKPEQSSTPMINADLMFQTMEQQRELAWAMKKRELQMYVNKCVMAEKCRGRVPLE